VSLDDTLPWVLLRGLTRETRHWGDFPAQLRAVQPGAPIIALDLPGNGALHAQRSPASVPAMAAHCRAALQTLDVAPPYRVLAMSLGAMVAVAWAQAQPRELAAAVLINTSLRPFGAFHQRLRPSRYATLLRLALSDPGAAEWERSILALTSRRRFGTAERDALLGAWTEWRRECPVSRANALRQLLAAARFRAPPPRPPVPLLVLASTRDALVDPQCSRRLAQAWALPIAEHPTAGHDLPLDDGAWVARQVERWVCTSKAP
jgi:pimeloyl-ACP methyl ester carboxylesterase